MLTTRDPQSSILITQNADANAPAVRPPREVASQLNRQFPMTGKQGKYFTMAYAVLDTETCLLRYAIAGHPPPILVRRGCAPERLPGGDLPIGITEDAEFEDHSIRFEPGDRLYFYSDGITEAMNCQNEMLQTEGFVELIESIRARTLDEGLASCVEQVKRSCHPVPLPDDLSLLALEIPSPG